MALASVAGWQHQTHRTRSKVVQNIGAGRASLRTTPTGANELWTSSTVTITLDPTVQKLTPHAKDAVEHAYGAWLGDVSTLPQVTFDIAKKPGKAEQDGVNLVLVGPITVPGQEEDLALTIGYADETTGELVEADTIFNSAYDWTSIEGSGDGSADCGNKFDLQNVATHEAGHFFGLGEDMTDTSNTMYYKSLPCQTSKRAPTSVDVSVITGLYAQAQTSAPTSGGCSK